MVKKKTKARSPSDLQGLANMMSNNSIVSDQSNSRKSNLQSPESTFPSPRKLADDFHVSPLKNNYFADIETKEKAKQILKLKISVQIGKNVGSANPQLLLNANDMRKAALRSGGNVCLGCMNYNAVIEDTPLIVATVWPSSDMKAGFGALSGPTSHVYNDWLQQNITISSLCQNDAVNHDGDDKNDLSACFTDLQLNETPPVTPNRWSPSSYKPRQHSSSENASDSKDPKRETFVFRKSDFSPSPDKVNSNSFSNEKIINQGNHQWSYYCFSVEKALDVILKKQYVNDSPSAHTPDKLTGEDDFKLHKRLQLCFTFQCGDALPPLSSGVVNAHEVNVYHLTPPDGSADKVSSVGVIIRSVLRSNLVPVLRSNSSLSRPLGFVSVMAKGEVWNLALEFPLDKIDIAKNDEYDENIKTISVYRITVQTDIQISDEPYGENASKKSDEMPEPTEQINDVWGDVGGLQAQIKQLREAIELPLRNPEVFDHFGVLPPRGVLLVGPPGTGKTTIARTFAKSANIVMHVINGAEITSRYSGEGEDSLRKAFALAEGLGGNKGKLLFIDEIDALAPAVASLSSESDRRLVATLLALMDGLESSAEMRSKQVRVMVLAATNRPFSLEPALRRPGRFDLEIEVGIPDESSRRDILRVLLRKLPCHYRPSDEGDSLDSVIATLAEHSHGFVGADLQLLCSEAILAGVRGHFRQSKEARMELRRCDLIEGLQKVKPSALREISVEVPTVRWSDIGGQTAAKQSLKEMIDWPLRFPLAFQRLGVRPPSGVLLYGPPGCSKTLIAKALATESKMNFIAVQGPELLSKWLGESERALATVFKRARAASPSIVFFDEIDSIGAKRGTNSDSQTSERLLTQLLVELDGAIHGGQGKVVVVAATNRPDLLDDALLRPGRLDRHVYISPPNIAARCDILKLTLAKTPHTLCDELVDSCSQAGLLTSDDKIDQASKIFVVFEENIHYLASLTEGLSGAEMVALVRDASLRAIGDRHKEGGQIIEEDALQVTAAHLMEAAVAAVKGKRITPSMIQFYEEFAKTGT